MIIYRINTRKHHVSPWPKSHSLSSIVRRFWPQKPESIERPSSILDAQTKNSTLRYLADNVYFQDAFYQAFDRLLPLYGKDTVYRLRDGGEVLALHINMDHPSAMNLHDIDNARIKECVLILIENALRSSLNDHSRKFIGQSQVPSFPTTRFIPAEAESFIAKNTPWLLNTYNEYIHDERLVKTHPEVLNQLHFMNDLYVEPDEVRRAWFSQILNKDAVDVQVEFPELLA